MDKENKQLASNKVIYQKDSIQELLVDSKTNDIIGYKAVLNIKKRLKKSNSENNNTPKEEHG